MFQTGDKIKVKYHPKNPEGVVTGWDIRNGSLVYHVDFDDKKLIPASMSYEAEHIEHMKSASSINKIKCECGISTTYGDDINREFHSTWCPMYRSNQ